MTSNEIIRDIMKNEGIRQIDMQEKMGFKSQSQVSAMVRSDMRCSTLVRALDALGYIVTITKIDDEDVEYIMDE